MSPFGPCASSAQTCVAVCSSDRAAFVLRPLVVSAPHKMGDGGKTGAELLEMMRDFARPAKVLDRHDDAVCHKICQIAWAYQVAKAKDLVLKAEGRPVLFSYGSDGTPVLARMTTTARLPSGKTVVRNAGQGVEFLLQRGFICFIDDSGNKFASALSKAPLPLNAGKAAWNVFSASCAFLPTLRRLSHSGIAISHYAFDRALFSSLARKQAQRHALFYERLGGGDKSGALALQELQDWVLYTPCANHDAHNALKWCLSSFAEDPEVVNKLHIVVESLRNGFSSLQERLHAFVPEVMRFSDEEEDENEVFQSWTVLGVEPEVASILTDLNLRWRIDGAAPLGGNLLVQMKHKGRDDLFELTTSAILGLLRFKKFTDSRWVTIGDSCRSLVAAVQVGLLGLVTKARKDPRASDYYLHGFANFTEDVKVYAVVASVSSRVADAALLALLEDDRVALKATHIANAMHEEVMWISNISAFAWMRLRAILKDASPQWLRSACLSAGHTACAFFHRRVLLTARSYPWRLIQGDVLANLEALATKPDIAEETTAKIQKLVRMRCDLQSLAQGVRLFGEASWSTTVVEQGHGSLATMHKAHRMYGASMLASRAMLHMVRPLLPEVIGEEARRSAERRLQRAERKVPERVSGRQIFLRERMSAASSSQGPGGDLSQEGRQALMKMHSSMFKSLDAEARDAYDRAARLEAASKRQRLDEEVLACHAAEVASKRELTEERLDKSFRLSMCRYSMADMDAMAALWADPRFSLRRATAEWSVAMSAPEAPSEEAQRQLESISIEMPTRDTTSAPAWAKKVSEHRRQLANCALVFSNGGDERAFMLLYALQSPMQATFIALDSFGTDDAEMSRCAHANPCFCKERYDFVYKARRTYVREVEIPFDEETEVFVLSDMAFVGQGVLASHSMKVPIDDFLHEALQAKKKTAHSRNKPDDDRVVVLSLVERYPFLKAYTNADLGGNAGAPSGASSSGTSRDVGALGDEQLEEVWSILEARRKEWRSTLETPPEDFTTSILGGAWTKANLGVAADAIKASARGSQALAWCVQYKLGRQRSFSFRKYGDGAASQLALCWAKRMQYFYDLFKESKNSQYEYTDEDLESAPGVDAAPALLGALLASHPAHAALREIAAMAPGIA